MRRSLLRLKRCILAALHIDALGDVRPFMVPGSLRREATSPGAVLALIDERGLAKRLPTCAAADTVRGHAYALREQMFTLFCTTSTNSSLPCHARGTARPVGRVEEPVMWCFVDGLMLEPFAVAAVR